MVTAVSATAEQARLVATAHRRASDAPPTASSRRPTQMRRIAQEVSKAIGEQGTRRARHHQGGAGHHQNRGAGAQGVGRAGDVGRPDHARPPIRCAAAPRSTSRALAEQATAADQIVAATASLNGMIGTRQPGDERAGGRVDAGQHRDQHDAARIRAGVARARRTDPRAEGHGQLRPRTPPSR